MPILGYADRLSVEAGERIRFMVSTDVPAYRADIVRLLRAARPAAGVPGKFVAPVVPTAIGGEYPGRRQSLHAGSYAIVPDVPALRLDRGLTLQVWVNPGLPRDGREQGVVGHWSGSGAPGGYGLALDAAGRLVFRLGAGVGRQVRTERELRRGQWWFAAATYDPETGAARLVCDPLPRGWIRDAGERVKRSLPGATPAPADAPFLIAASHLAPDANGRACAAGLFNGKIEGPRLWNRALGDDEIAALRADAPVGVLADGLVAAWDFSLDAESSGIRDTSGNGLHGTLVNLPTRAVTGHNWTGEELSFRSAAHQYGAIHFHDDDFEDAGWEPSFALEVPDDLESGIYAARLAPLASGEAEEFVPFYVRPPLEVPTAAIAFLAPTHTYLAYANDRLYSGTDYPRLAPAYVGPPGKTPLHEHPELGRSLYDLHRDGSGVCYSSRLRPVVTMRPSAVTWTGGGPRHFAADLHLIEWLDRKRFRCDAVTDEDLHRDGLTLLAPYRVVVTGSHPEYWTGAMLAALEAYLAGGGRLMYLGGNGFYWVTGVDDARPHLVEIRRGVAGTRSWESAPGEAHLSLTGEPGGLWRHRGKPPQALCGVGFSALGGGSASGYRRLPDSHHPRAAWIFAGVGDDEAIGDFGLIMGGAAGDEIDRADGDLGTPSETLVLATSRGQHPDRYLLTVEDVPITRNGLGGTTDPKVRADITYTELAEGGAVFSVGSVNWCGSLLADGADNNVSRVTENVLRRFST